MAVTGLSGSYALNDNSIDTVLKHKSPGAYALGHTENGSFYVKYVGRADVDLRVRLKDHVGNYARFKCDYFASKHDAFVKECELYHDFSPRDNKIHPARPAGSNWTCPRCSALG